MITDYKNLPSGQITYTVDDIKYIAGLSETYKVSDIKLKILSKSIKEINEKTNLNISLVVNKRGTKIVSFTFKFYDKEKDLGKERLLFRMWLYEYMLNKEFSSGKLQLKFYLSKNKKGNVLIYDIATKKPIRRDLSFKVYDYLFEQRENFFNKEFKHYYDTPNETIEEELKHFEQEKEFYLTHEEMKNLDEWF